MKLDVNLIIPWNGIPIEVSLEQNYVINKLFAFLGEIVIKKM